MSSRKSIADMIATHPWSFRILAWAVATGLTALIGPFTTYGHFTLAERLAYWGGIIGASLVLGFWIRAMMVRRLGAESLKGDMIGAGIMSLLFGSLLWAFNFYVIGFQVQGVLLFVEHVAAVWFVCLAVVTIRLYLRLNGVATAEPGTHSAPAEPSPSPFLQSLGVDDPADVLRVSADDHYLHVVTRAGDRRVLMRFRDALTELSALPGLRIHRSHWVSREVVTEVRQDGRRYLATFPCGTVLPVSAAYVDDLRAAGLLRE